MENAVKFLMKFWSSSFLKKRSSKVPRFFHLGAGMPINIKHINIFLTALAGQSSQGRTPTRPRDKRDKIAALLWIRPGTGPILSRGGVPFVPGTVPVCPGHRPAENVYGYWFFSCQIHNRCHAIFHQIPLYPKLLPN